MSRTTGKMLAAAALPVLIAGCAQPTAGSNLRPDSVSVSQSVAPSTSDGNTLSRDRAVEIALDRTGGGNVDEVENEVEHGRAAWKVRVVKDGIRYSVYIDKADGAIIRFRDEGRD